MQKAKKTVTKLTALMFNILRLFFFKKKKVYLLIFAILIIKTNKTHEYMHFFYLVVPSLNC